LVSIALQEVPKRRELPGRFSFGCGYFGTTGKHTKNQ
jgi:hypothetical protein